MKNTFLIIPLLFLLSSCDLIDAVDGCDKPKKMELTESDKRWIPKDTTQYFIKETDTFKINIKVGEAIYNTDRYIQCAYPVEYIIPLVPIVMNNDSSKFISTYALLYKSPKETNISYNFSKITPNNLIVGTSQMMGMIDLDRNLPVPMDDSYFIHSEYLGNHTIRGREYTEVYKFTDLDESNVPEIDVSSITVSSIGFLRIEFYSGEVWERVIIE